MKISILIVVISIITTLIITGCFAQKEKPKYITENNIIYGKIGAKELGMNMVTLDNEKKNKPAVIIIHGGGWEAGSKEDAMWMAYDMANLGFTAFSISYRLTGDAPYPAQIEDCKTAVRFVRANAEKFNINPDKIGAYGHSAGGHLASMLGVLPDRKYEGDLGNKTTSSAVQAVINNVGPVDLEYYKEINGTPAIIRENNFPKLFGKNKEGMDYWIKEASPITFVSEKSVPHIVLYGTDDDLVPYKQGYPFVEKMKQNKIYCEFRVIEDGGHILDTKKINPLIEAFCHKFLLD